MMTTRSTGILVSAALLWPLALLGAGCGLDASGLWAGPAAAGSAGSGGSGGDSGSGSGGSAGSGGAGGSGGAAAVLTAANDSYTVTANGYLVEGAPGVLANDVAPVSAVTVTLLSDAAHGTLELAGDGSFEYAPRPFFVGTDSFEYSVDDGTATSSATATITVLPDVGDGSDGDLVVSDGEAKQDVNTCYVLESTGGASVMLTSPVLAVGDRLLLLQVQEGSATLGDQTPLGPSSLLSHAGVSQIVTVTSVSGAGIGVAPPPIYGFHTTAGSATAQACVVPQYSNVTVAAGATIQPASWDGSSNGVVAFFVAGTATINGVVSASARGFRGGQLRGNVIMDDVTALETFGNEGGGKGEGPDASSYGRSGRGNLFCAAGGGNGSNAGGGGGGHYGAGGFGGKQWVGAGDEPDTRGMGGAAFLFPVQERLLLGGGGGAGQQNDSHGGAGGNGGGIVFIWAGTINGSGNLVAAGQDGGTSNAGGADGAGGGGAGGTIFVRALAAAFSGIAQAVGGNGGDITGTTVAHGPGGGGGGGRLLLVGLGSITTNVAGGSAGHYGSDPWGAADGAVGDATVVPYR